MAQPPRAPGTRTLPDAFLGTQGGPTVAHFLASDPPIRATWGHPSTPKKPPQDETLSGQSIKQKKCKTSRDALMGHFLAKDQRLPDHIGYRY